MKTNPASRRRALSDAGSSLVPSYVATLLALFLVAPRSDAQGSRRAPAAKDASSIEACALLTPAEIQQALGVPVKAGVKQTTDTSSQCQWDSVDESAAFGVSVSVATYDDVLFKQMTSSKNAVPVPGIGESAFKGYPHAGDLIIKQGAYEIDLGIVDFRPATAKVDAAAQQLAKLVLSRLGAQK